MRRLVCYALLSVLLVGGCWSSALAEDWAVISAGPGADEYDMDLATVSRTGAFVHSWVREIYAKPRTDPATRQTSVREVAAWDIDCTGRRILLGEQLKYDAQGTVIGRVPARADWEDVVPDSLGGAVLKMACRASEPFADKPLLQDLFAGNWINLGPSSDGIRSLALNLDRVVKLDDDNVLFVTRGEATTFEVIDGFAIKYSVSAYVLNCKTPKVAFFAADGYWTPTARAISQRVPTEQISMAPIPGGSYVAHYYRQICSAAVPAEKDGPGGAAGQGDAEKVGLGTAWVGDKGYLITASHVIANAVKIEVYSDGQRLGTAKVVVDDPANDVAILKFAPVHRSSLRALAIAHHGAALGRSIFTLGYPAPDVLGQRIKMTAGQVSGTAGMQDDARFLQISAPLQPGNSGGPILGWDGEVVGIADMVLQKLDENPDGPRPQNVNYAVKASYVRAMLDDLPDLGGYAYVRAAGLGHDALVAAARKAVYMLVVTSQGG